MPHLLMVERADRPEHTPESESLLVDTDTPGVIRMVLDDGLEIVAPREAFMAALASSAQAAA